MSDPKRSCAVFRVGTRGGVNASHWSLDRLGSSATIRTTLAPGGAVLVGNRRLRQTVCGPMSMG
ncbi:Uncharacterised protein [Mycobacteroides abscessus subsp. abscessus]|nr:Uncharacterised protein [Mycobacteroides abscessus subsp. abscessus]